MAGSADTGRIDAAAEGLVVDHCVDNGTEMNSSQPHQRIALDRVSLQRIVAGMIDRDGNKTVRRQCRAEPSEIGRRTAETVRQEYQRPPGPRRVRRIGCGAASAVE